MLHTLWEIPNETELIYCHAQVRKVASLRNIQRLQDFNAEGKIDKILDGLFEFR